MKSFKSLTLILGLLFTFSISFHAFSQEGRVTINQDERISQLLELKKDINKDETNPKRYKIQIYSGNRAGAKNAETNFTETFNQWRPRMHYETPNFKVWAGNFSTRLEADRALRKIRKKFPNAFIFKPKK